MTAYVCSDLLTQAPVPAQGILSRTLLDDATLRIVVLAFSAGHELSAHSTPRPVVIQILSGSARVRLGDETHDMKAGSLARLPSGLEHAVTALEPTTLLLTMEKAA